MTVFRLAPEAEDRLADAFQWTVEHLGRAQAERLRDDVIARCTALADGRVIHRTCHDVIAPEASHDLRFVRAGRALIFFLRQATDIVVIDVLHDSRDLGTALARLDLHD
jgi:plasmid stabilization system protein ParE